MQYDKNAIFSDNQAITATAASTNNIETAGDIAAGTPVPFAIEITETFNNLTSLTIAIETADTEAALVSSPVTLYSETFLAAKLVKGAVVGTNVFPKGAKHFCRMKYTVTGTAPTTGKIKAGVVVAVPASYEDM